MSAVKLIFRLELEKIFIPQAVCRVYGECFLKNQITTDPAKNIRFTTSQYIPMLL